MTRRSSTRNVYESNWIMAHSKAFTDFISISLAKMQKVKITLLHLQNCNGDRAPAAIPNASLADDVYADFKDVRHIVSFSWAIELSLSKLRNPESNVKTEMVAVLIECCDHASELLNAFTQTDTQLETDHRDNNDPVTIHWQHTTIPVEHIVKSIDLIRRLRNIRPLPDKSTTTHQQCHPVTRHQGDSCDSIDETHKAVMAINRLSETKEHHDA